MARTALRREFSDLIDLSTPLSTGCAAITSRALARIRTSSKQV
jgi:hypothetical protein